MTINKQEKQAEKGERLRKVIHHTGMTQKKFAEKIGVTPGYVTAVVNGFKDISGGFIEKFATKFGNTYNLAWLLVGSGNMLLNDEDAKMIVEEPKPAYVSTPFARLEKRVEVLESQMKHLFEGV